MQSSEYRQPNQYGNTRITSGTLKFINSKLLLSLVFLTWTLLVQTSKKHQYYINDFGIFFLKSYDFGIWHMLLCRSSIFESTNQMLPQSVPLTPVAARWRPPWTVRRSEPSNAPTRPWHASRSAPASLPPRTFRPAHRRQLRTAGIDPAAHKRNPRRPRPHAVAPGLRARAAGRPPGWHASRGASRTKQTPPQFVRA